MDLTFIQWAMCPLGRWHFRTTSDLRSAFFINEKSDFAHHNAWLATCNKQQVPTKEKLDTTSISTVTGSFQWPVCCHFLNFFIYLSIILSWSSGWPLLNIPFQTLLLATKHEILNLTILSYVGIPILVSQTFANSNTTK